MGGMLPGVELARKRKVHHHEAQAWGPPQPSSAWVPAAGDRLAAPMSEPALMARRRLEEKLRRFDVGLTSPSSSPSASASASASALPRWIRHVVGEGERRRQKEEDKHGRKKRDSNPMMMDVCAVCLDEMEEEVQQQWSRRRKGVMRLPCSHKYHSDCLLPWLAVHSHCPCCRTFVPSLAC